MPVPLTRLEASMAAMACRRAAHDAREEAKTAYSCNIEACLKTAEIYDRLAARFQAHADTPIRAK